MKFKCEKFMIFNISCGLECSQQRIFQTSIFQIRNRLEKLDTNIEKSIKTQSMNIGIKCFAEIN